MITAGTSILNKEINPNLLGESSGKKIAKINPKEKKMFAINKILLINDNFFTILISLLFFTNIEKKIFFFFS